MGPATARRHATSWPTAVRAYGSIRGCLAARLVVPAMLLLGCATATGGPAAAADPIQRAPPAARSPLAVAASPAPRAPETFAALLRTPVDEDRQRTGCLLAQHPGGWLLGSSASLATQTWPALPEDPVAIAAEASQRVRVLTHWGAIGSADAGPIVVAATPIPPAWVRRPAVVVFVGPDGPMPVRYSDRPGGTATDRVSLASRVAEALGQGPASLWIAAGRDTPVARLHAVLAALPTPGTSAVADHGAGVEQASGLAPAFAVALPTGTTLPEPPTPSAIAAHCKAGLPEADAERAAGDLAPSAIDAGLRGLTAGLKRCADEARGPAAAGGRVVLATRVDARGSVEHACLLEDTIADPTFAACVVAHARAVHFPSPHPAGFVDMHLPLAISPEASTVPRPLCPSPHQGGQRGQAGQAGQTGR